jgi:enamine deaminase RidA (YjgF/YER057c/UK114 family)
MTKPSQRLKEMGINLPPVAKPLAAYVPFVRHGDVLMLSGQVTMKDGKLAYVGKVGRDQPLEAAQDAAKICALNSIAIAADAAGGIDNIARVLKVVVYVASAEGFTDQHLVANGASKFLQELFGEAGVHARAAVGVAELPMNSSVEIDITFTVKA